MHGFVLAAVQPLASIGSGWLLSMLLVDAGGCFIMRYTKELCLAPVIGGIHQLWGADANGK